MLDMMDHEIDQLLADANIGRLCMADTHGQPYVIPLPFCWLDNGLYLRLPLTGRKGQILTTYNQVCFEVDYFSDDLDEYASVLVEGRLISVDSFERIKTANDEKYTRLRGGYRPGHGRGTPLDTLPMKRIAVDRISGRKKNPSAVVSLAMESQ